MVNSWEYNAQNHNSNLDHNCQPLLFQYQELLKGVGSKDTNYIKEVVNATIHLTDSLSSLKFMADSNLNKIWVDGLGNVNAEFQGLLAENINDKPTEFNMSLNMCGIQLLNLLGQIGYQQHSIYIFHSKVGKTDDGYYWFGIQKTAKDPFKVDNRDFVSADGILQEAK
jgi:hypothetical protein